MKKSLLISLVFSLLLSTTVFAIDYSNVDTIKQVQEALNTAGYNCGTPDGIVGNGTRSQIEKYRTDKGLTAGNSIDDELYNSLFNIAAPEVQAEVTPEEETTVSLHLDSQYGIIDFVRYELDGNDLFLVFDYKNTTDETTMPITKYSTTVFQNGKEVSLGFSMNKPSDCDDGITQIRPNTTLRYSVVYNLPELSPIEVEVFALFDFSKNISDTILIDFNNTSVASSPLAETNASENVSADNTTITDETLKNQLSEANKRIEELEKQLKEANSKVSELQGQLDTIKAAIGG